MIHTFAIWPVGAGLAAGAAAAEVDAADDEPAAGVAAAGAAAALACLFFWRAGYRNEKQEIKERNEVLDETGNPEEVLPSSAFLVTARSITLRAPGSLPGEVNLMMVWLVSKEAAKVFSTVMAMATD